MAEELRRDAQRAAMLRYGWSREDWIRRFGRSALGEEEEANWKCLKRVTQADFA